MAGISVLNQWAERWQEWMLPMSWQVAVQFAAVWTMCLVARKASPRLRYALWCLVLVKLCLPPGIAFVTGIGQWLPARPLRQTEAHGRHIRREVSPIVQPELREPAAPAFSSAEPVVHSPTVTPRISTSDLDQPAAPSISWPALVFIVWAGGVLVMAGLLAATCVRVYRQLAAGAVVNDATVVRVLCEARADLGLVSCHASSVG